MILIKIISHIISLAHQYDAFLYAQVDILYAACLTTISIDLAIKLK